MRLLESKRLLIKPTEEEDIYQLLEFRWEASTSRNIIHQPISRADQLRWFHNRPGTDVTFSVFEKRGSDLILIGTSSLCEIDMRHQRASLRSRFGEIARGKGYGTEAWIMVIGYGFDVLNLRKICADIFPENEASMKLMSRVGAKEEGLLRQHYYQNGRFRDVVVWGILKDDFLRAREAYYQTHPEE